MSNGITEALKGEVEANRIIEGEGEGDKGEKKPDENKPGLGEEAEVKLKEALESGAEANSLIEEFGGVERTKEIITFLQSPEFKEKMAEKKTDLPAGSEPDEKQQATDLIQKWIRDAINPLQSQIAQLTKQTTGRVGDMENLLATSNLTNALDRLSKTYPDLSDYREGIIKHVKELYPKGNFTEENIKNVYLLSKINKGKIDDGSVKENPNKLKTDLSNLNLGDLKKDLSKKGGKKSFGDIYDSIVKQAS